MMSNELGDSIHAYDQQDRIARYDEDMELMHPNRRRMVEVMLEALPMPRQQAVTIMDLGVGTGYVARRVLDAFPDGRVFAVDGAEAMIEAARSRLAEAAERASLFVGTFAEIGSLDSIATPLDAVLSAYALHHLTADEKLDCLRQCFDFLKPGGWFLNADVVLAESVAVERRIQEIRADGIVRRARQRDERFMTVESTRRFLDEMEAAEGDRPMTLVSDLRICRDAGFESVFVFWKEYREVVYGGQRPE